MTTPNERLTEKLNRHVGESGWRADLFGFDAVVIEMSTSKLNEILDRLDRAKVIEQAAKVVCSCSNHQEGDRRLLLEHGGVVGVNPSHIFVCGESFDALEKALDG